MLSSSNCVSFVAIGKCFENEPKRSNVPMHTAPKYGSPRHCEKGTEKIAKLKNTIDSQYALTEAADNNR